MTTFNNSEQTYDVTDEVKGSVLGVAEELELELELELDDELIRMQIIQKTKMIQTIAMLK